jgi:hypothetical protein
VPGWSIADRHADDRGADAALPIVDDVDEVYPVEEGPAISLSELGPLWVPAGWAEDGGLFVRQLYDIPARVYRLDLGTRRREPLVTIAPPESSGVHWMSRLKVTPDKRIVGFTYSVESNTVLALDWHERN